MSDPKQAILLDGDDSEEEDEDIGVASVKASEGSGGVEESKGNDGDAMVVDEPATQRRKSLIALPRKDLEGFSEAQLTSASEVFREAWSRVQADQWDVKSWQTLISEAQMQRAGRAISLREVYRLVLKQFPATVKLWKELAEHEMRQGNLEEVDAVLKECLLECPSVELFTLYVQRVRKANPQTDGYSGSPEAVEKQREQVTAAFEFAIKHIGLAVDATPLWWEYITYIQAWKEEGDTSNKLALLRKVFQRALQVPLDRLDDIWQTYESWEKGMNEHMARLTMPALQPAFNQAKAVAKERRAVLDQQKLSKMAVPPTNNLEEKEQLGFFRKRVDYEKGNPDQVDPVALKDRMRLCYRTSLAYFFRFPEVWHEFAQYEAETENLEAAASLYERAIAAVPDSLLLHNAYAELEEARGQAEHGADLLKGYLERHPGTLGYVLYQQYVRRTQGKEAARRVFSSTKELRKKGTLGFQFYLAHARLEQYMNESNDVARRVLDYGLAQHPEFLLEPEYVLAFADLLIQLHDDQNVRGLCDRALAAMGAMDKAKAVWDRLLDFEMTMASNRDMARVEQVQKRMAEVFPAEKERQGFMRLWKRVSLLGIEAGNESDDLARQRYGYGDAMEGGRLTAMGRPPMVTGLESIKAEAAAGNQAPQPLQPALRRGTDPIMLAIQQRRLQSIPEYLRKLYTLLPQQSGPPPDIDTIVRSLRENPLPPRPSGPPTYGSADGPAAPIVSTAMKRRWAGGDEDDSEDDAIGPRGGADVFRARQQDKLMRTFGSAPRLPT